MHGYSSRSASTGLDGGGAAGREEAGDGAGDDEQHRRRDGDAEVDLGLRKKSVLGQELRAIARARATPTTRPT